MRPKVLALSSGGGHWIQLCRVLPALDGADVALATVVPENRSEFLDHRFYIFEDATRWDRWKLIKCAVSILRILLRERPDVVLTTGAAPGGLALLFSKFLGARTIWIDSIANVDSISMTGRHAGRVADLWLTQWPHLDSPKGPHFRGSVL